MATTLSSADKSEILRDYNSQSRIKPDWHYTTKSGAYTVVNGQVVPYTPGMITQATTNYERPSVVSMDTPSTKSSTPTPIFSSAADTEKPTTKITGTLTQGSTGDGVKEIQKWLRDTQGAINADGTPLKVDGLYGPQTITAIKHWQQQNGLTPDGVFGPKSFSVYQKLSTSPTTNAAKAADDPSYQYNQKTGEPNPNYDPARNLSTTKFNTGDPSQDALLNELQSYIKSQQDAGLKINDKLNFDQKTLDKFLETAKKQVHPFYQQQIDNIKDEVLRTAPQILQNYGSDVAGAEQDFQNKLGNARESYADSGLAFSGQRGKGELGMQSDQNRNLEALSQGYGNKLYDLGRGAEEKIGSSNVNYNLGALKNYSTSLSGNGGFTLGGTTTPYRSGNVGTGSLEYNQEADTEARRQALLRSASESVVAGRDYNDLFQ